VTRMRERCPLGETVILNEFGRIVLELIPCAIRNIFLAAAHIGGSRAERNYKLSYKYITCI